MILKCQTELISSRLLLNFHFSNFTGEKILAKRKVHFFIELMSKFVLSLNSVG